VPAFVDFAAQTLWSSISFWFTAEPGKSLSLPENTHQELQTLKRFDRSILSTHFRKLHCSIAGAYLESRRAAGVLTDLGEAMFLLARPAMIRFTKSLGNKWRF
jgi:hypothetical protein